MTISALDNLDSKWKEWLNNSLNNQVKPATLAVTLFEEGLVDAAFELIKNNNKPINKPHIDVSKNNISLADKDVSIMFTSNKPSITIIESFLSIDECSRLINCTEKQLNSKKIFSNDKVAKNSALASQVSKSTELHTDTKLVATVEERIAELLHWPADHGGHIKTIKCEIDESYRPHTDLLKEQANGDTLSSAKHGGQCVGVFLMILSDVDNNGGTLFPSMNMTLRLKAGTAIYLNDFSININTISDEQAMSIKENSPVTTGVRYMATKYLKEHAYH